MITRASDCCEWLVTVISGWYPEETGTCEYCQQMCVVVYLDNEDDGEYYEQTLG